MSEPPLDIRLPGHADRISAARMIDTTNPTIYLPFIFTPAKEKGLRSRPPPHVRCGPATEIIAIVFPRIENSLANSTRLFVGNAQRLTHDPF